LRNTSRFYIKRLSLPLYPLLLPARVLAALKTSPEIVDSGGSRLLVYNHAQTTLEARLTQTFREPPAPLFNSDFDANAGFFACVPQPGNALLYDSHPRFDPRRSVRIMVAPRFRRPSARSGPNV